MSNNNQACESVLHMEHIVFDILEFERLGFDHKNSKTKFEFGVGIAQKSENSNEASTKETYRVTLNVTAIRDNEYKATVRLSGYFVLDKAIEDADKKILLEQNAVAVLFPYVRSEFTLLTTQPETRPIVIPVMNIVDMMNNAEEVDISEGKEETTKE